MNVLVIGSGGREHSLAWKAAQSPLVDRGFVAPGNAGTAREPALSNIAIDTLDFAALADFAEANDVGLTLVGPEAPLVAGVVDYFRGRGLPCFGPSKAAAQLEGSKSFTKDFLKRHKIPTASYQTFTEVEAAKAYVRAQGAPIVIKADGLAAGKGVVVAMTEEDALAALEQMLGGEKSSGAQVVIEAFMAGEEASFIVMADGEDFVAFPTSQDHKRRFDGDQGPNTGGMGAYSPAPVVTPDMEARIMREVMEPAVAGMAADGYPYVGFLYAGIMVMADGTPKVLEFNCRFGDPETQPVLLRLQSDLVDLCLAAINNDLDSYEIKWTNKHSCGVVIASKGYPESYESDKEVMLPNLEDNETKLFHAGTKLINENVLTSGGRVFCATALGDNLKQAQSKAYNLVDKVSFDGAFCRRDIGFKGIK